MTLTYLQVKLYALIQLYFLYYEYFNLCYFGRYICISYKSNLLYYIILSVFLIFAI